MDRCWDALLAGATAERCGWLKDRYGASWQIVPVPLESMMANPDRAKATRAMDAMLKMVKLDVAALQRAVDDSWRGRAPPPRRPSPGDYPPAITPSRAR